MTNHVYVAASLDGFIATREGGVDWLSELPNPDGSDYGFSAFMSGIDAVVMGRNTFDQVFSFDVWPYDRPVFVLSTSLDCVPEAVARKAEIMRGEPKAVVEQLARRGYSNLYIDGGKTIQNFLEEDLIDELIITRVPILLGDGIPLFGKLTTSLWFASRKTERLNEMLVKNYYSRVRG
jgi:dihydrofolate reductase